MTEKQVTIRVKVAGDKVTQSFRLYGKEGEEAISRITAAARVQNRTLNRSAGQFRQTSAAAGAFSGGMRNASLQLSQVAQQASATGDWVRALSIQLPDLALGFGTVGIAIGALAGVALPMLAETIMGGSDSAEAMKERVKDLEAATKAYRQAAENAARPTSDLAKEFGVNTGQARRLYQALAALERLDVTSSLRETQQALATRFGVLDRFDPQDYVNAGKALASLQERLNELRQGAQPTAVDEGQRIQQQINQMGQLAAAVQKVQAEFRLSAEQAGVFAAAISEFQTSETGTQAQAEALQKVRAILVDAVTNSKNLTEEQEALARSIVSSEQALLNFVAATSSAESGTAATASAASQLAAEMRDAVRAAQDFVSNLGSMSLAGLRAEVAALESGADRISASVARREAEIRSSAEFQRAISSPVPGLGQEAMAGLERELELTRQQAELAARRSEALKELSTSARGAAGSTEKLTAAQRAANQAMAQAQASAVTYADIVSVLDKKLKSGEISQEIYTRSLEKAREHLEGLGKGARDVEGDFAQMITGLVTGSLEAEQVLARLQAALLKMLFSSLLQSTGLGSFISASFGGTSGGGIPGFASGTDYAPGGPAIVGERGIELVDLPRGSRVMSNPETQRVMAKAGGQTGQVVHVTQQVINNVPGVEIEQRRERDADGREMLISEVNDAAARGRLTGIESRYGSRPKVRRR
ncbi:hypothetical protein [Roseovarius indicus]|uniref:hypothetical protein n=1 Tax=Roseovarius indicus TaxID=540747 RepID=UPI0007D9CA45|nr:hypothetical protein [Roseovarius indicus]OAO02716.1 hypothetical protein A8B76_05075 [Roseovarius indicus]